MASGRLAFATRRGSKYESTTCIGSPNRWHDGLPGPKKRGKKLDSDQMVSQATASGAPVCACFSIIRFLTQYFYKPQT